MMAGEYLRMALPYFNLVLVLMVIVFLLRILLIKNKNTYVVPWRFLFFSVSAYVVEEILTIIDMSGIVSIHNLIFPVIEMVIICSFIYMVLLQKKYNEMQK